jgi:agmatine deiminase
MTYRMPAEWESHEATWLGWPHELTDWPGKFAPIPWAFAEIVRHLARVERVLLLVENRDAESRVKAILRKSGANLDAVTFFRVPTDRGWMRDSGPISVIGNAEQPDALSSRQRRAVRADEGSAVAFGDEEQKQIPRTASRAPENRGRGKSAQDSARDDSSHLGAALLNFAFNGWAKYDDHKKDAKVVARVAPMLSNGRHRTQEQRRAQHGSAALTTSAVPLPKHGATHVVLPEHKGRRIVLEGGAIDVNGRGSLLTTEECLLSRVQERNPGFTREDYAEIFRRYLGATNVLWLRNGIAGDDTHGHVDDLARFVDPSTVVTVIEKDPAEANHAPLAENLALLREMKDQDGRPLRVETLPMPEPIYFDGQRLPASYANFYIANKIVLVPTFNDPADRVALETLAKLFPAREIVPIYCRDLVLGLGTIHCMTQQMVW